MTPAGMGRANAGSPKSCPTYRDLAPLARHNTRPYFPGVMQRAHWVGLLIILLVVVFQVRTTLRVFRSRLFDRPQKLAQAKLIWLLPVVGACLVASVLEDEDRRDRGSPPGIGT